MSQEQRRQVLEDLGLVHPRPEAVNAPLFGGGDRFFLAEDKLQVKYEMLRAHVVDGWSVTAAAEGHGYSRASFYVVSAAFEAGGMARLLDERPGRRGPLKLTGEVAAFVLGADGSLSGAEVARQVEARFGVVLHRRTVERARQR
jgi:transposase